MKANIDSEAIKLLEEADYVWSGGAFIKARDPNNETTQEYRSKPQVKISYEEIRDHGLLKSEPSSKREIGLKWLKNKLS